jgi:hemoglobin-like flavoprotein
MTRQEVQLIRDSFPSVREIARPLAMLFYGRLFELEPALRPMFRGDIEKQGVKLMDMLAAVVDSVDRLEELTPVLRAMGQRHAGYGVEDRHYAIVRQAFVWALGHALDGPDPALKEAWGKVIGQVGEEMLRGAHAARLPE